MSDHLAGLPMPVVVVAAGSADERSCSTGTLTYVSYAPPLVATPLAKTSTTLALLRRRRSFSLAILAEDQAEVAIRASRPAGRDKFAEQAIPVLEDEAAPAVAGASLVLWCSLESTHDAGRALLCVGLVERSRRGDGEPLVRFGRHYRALGAPIAVTQEAPYPL